MKKLLLGMVIGAAITGGIFYYIDKQNEDEAKENLKAFLTSMKESKTTQEKLDEALNDPKATMILSTALTVIIAPKDEFYYYKGNDCGKLVKTDLVSIKEIFSNEKNIVPAGELMIIIKKMPGTSLRNSMDLLDTITATGIPAGHFAEVAMTDNEKNCLQNYKKN